MPTSGLPGKQIFTVGHSTRGFDEFVELLRAHGIECLVDVRTAPKSRRMPHFAKESLAERLPGKGIEYVHEPGLGGWRKPVAGSPNGGWRSKSFQGYADHMQTPAFEAALGRVTTTATEKRSALMCAEALWWRCHRQLISDALVVRGWSVRHIGADREAAAHTLTSFAVVEDGRLTYPPAQPRLLDTT